MTDGLCKGNDYAWFHPPSFPLAKAVCELCPIKADCLESATENDEKFGVWGGKDPAERGYKHSEDGVSPYEPL